MTPPSSSSTSKTASGSSTATTLFTPTAAMTNLFLSTSSSPVTSATVTTGIVSESGSCQNHGTKKKNDDAVTLPSSSSSVKTLSGVTTEAAAAAARTTVSPPPAEDDITASAEVPPLSLPGPQDESPPPSTEDSHEECVLCCHPLPVKPEEHIYKECCGEVICWGCISAQQRTLIIGTNVKKPIAGSKEELLEFIAILSSEQVIVCPFCRAKDPINDKEFLKRLWERIDEYNDPKAMNILGAKYNEGECGLSKNLKKAKELYQKAYNLGDHNAAGLLAELYSQQIPDQAREMKYLGEGARRGNTHCMNSLAIRAAQSGDEEEAKRQFMTAACSGNDKGVHNLMIKYRAPGSVVSKDDLATTLRAHKAVHDKIKSEPREYAKRYKAFRDKVVNAL